MWLATGQDRKCPQQGRLLNTLRSEVGCWVQKREESLYSGHRQTHWGEDSFLSNSQARYSQTHPWQGQTDQQNHNVRTTLPIAELRSHSLD